MKAKLNHGDQVAFNWNGRSSTGKVVGVYPEFHSAVKVEKDGLEYILEATAVETIAEREERLEEERRAGEREKYADVIAAHGKGCVTAAAIATELKTSVLTASNRLKAAKRRGLVS